MRRVKSYPRKWCRNQADIMANFGAPAEELYLPGSVASGNITGAIGGNVLTAVTSPLYEQALTSLPGDPLGAGVDVSTADSFDSAVDKHLFGTAAYAVLVPLKLAAITNNRSLIGKWLQGTASGWVLFVANGKLYHYFGGAGGFSDVRSIAGIPTGSAIYAMPWRTGGSYGMYLSWESEVTEVRAADDVDVVSPFSLGAVDTNSACGCTLGPVIIWSGAAAETVIAARATTLPAWWAL